MGSPDCGRAHVTHFRTHAQPKLQPWHAVIVHDPADSVALDCVGSRNQQKDSPPGWIAVCDASKAFQGAVLKIDLRVLAALDLHER